MVIIRMSADFDGLRTSAAGADRFTEGDHRRL